MGTTNVEMAHEELGIFLDKMKRRYSFASIEALGAAVIVVEGGRVAHYKPISFVIAMNCLNRSQLRKALSKTWKDIKRTWPKSTELYWRKYPSIIKRCTFESCECVYTLRMRIGAVNV